ncbi:MAG: hypothetical protein HYZ00_00760 [Candidatus Hydrogenedentes bacterium]|nr:hypothetical protein [Candidatus Hydrogenedentota bacterium]
MPVKYECPKCEKRFVEWGAQKLNFMCPHCKGGQLVRVGASEDRPVRKPSLRRRGRAERVPAAPVELEAVEASVEEFVEEEEETEEPEVLAVIEGDLASVEKPVDEFDEDAVLEDEEGEVGADEEVPQDLEFGEDESISADLDEKL